MSKKVAIITHYYKSFNYGGNLQAYALAKKILAGGCVDDDENILTLQAATLTISTSAALTSDLDGEAGAPLPLKVETLRHAIKFFA